MATGTHPHPATGGDFAQTPDAWWCLDVDDDAALPVWAHGVIVGNPRTIENGIDRVPTNGGGGPSLVSYTPTDSLRGTRKGIRGNPAATGGVVKQGHARLGSIWGDGSFTICFEAQYDSLAWGSIPTNTYLWSFSASVDSGINSFFRVYARWTSATTFVVAYENQSTTTGGGVAIAATWTYGATSSGTQVQPSAPAADVPTKMIVTFNASDRKLRLYVENPAGLANDLGGYVLVSTSSAIASGNEIADALRHECVINVDFGANYPGASQSGTAWRLRDLIIAPGLRPPGASFTYNDTHSLTIDTSTNAGTVDALTMPCFHWGYFDTAKPSTANGVPVDGYGGTTQNYAIPQPRGATGIAMFIDKVQTVRMALTSSAVESELGWSSGKTMTDPLGTTRTGSTFYFDKAPIDLFLLQAAAMGVDTIIYCHNSVSELVSGTSPYRDGTRNRLTDHPGNSTHASYQPHTGGAAMDALDADICASMVHYIESWVGPNGETMTVPWVKLGTEADTLSQWSPFATAGVNAAYRYRYCRAALADYATQESHSAFKIIPIGFSAFISTSSNPYTIMDAFLAQCAAWSLPVSYWDPHFTYGPGGLAWAQRVVELRCSVNGISPAPVPVVLECAGRGETMITGSQTSHYRGHKNSSDTTGDVRRMWGINTPGAVELHLYERMMQRTARAAAAFIVPIKTGIESSAFYGKTETWWEWGIGASDGAEFPKMQAIRMKAECTGTLHTFAACTNSAVKAIAGTRTTDSKRWVWLSTGAFSGWHDAAKASLTINLGAANAGKVFDVFRHDSSNANYLLLDGHPNPGTIANSRIKPDATQLTANGSGVVTLTGLEASGLYLLLEATTAATLSAGVIVAGTATDTTAQVNSSTDASGGVAPLAYSWSYRVSGVGSYATVIGAAASTLTLSGLAASTTYQVIRRVTDNAGTTADSATITVTTSAQSGGGSSVTGVSLTPTAVTLLVDASQVFTATVNGVGSPSQGVTWSVDGTGTGTITSGGAYTAPSAAGVYTVRATSQADTSKSGTATVTVVASGTGQGGNLVVREPLKVRQVGAAATADDPYTISGWVGERPTYQLQAIDGNGLPVDLTGYTVTVLVSNRETDAVVYQDEATTAAWAAGGVYSWRPSIAYEAAFRGRLTLKAESGGNTNIFGPLRVEISTR